MIRFAYKAIDGSGRTVSAAMDAVNLDDLEQRLNRLGLELIRAKPRASRSLRSKTLPRRELIQLCFHIEQLARAGVPMLEALTDLRDSLDAGVLRQSVAGLVESISGGRTLSESMAMQPEAYPAVFRSLIKVGELTGRLPDVTAKLAESLKREDELASYAKRMTLYPALMLLVILGALAVCLVYLVPQLSSLFRSLGQDLPLHTRALIGASGLAVSYGHWALLGTLGVAALLRLHIQRSHSAARTLHRLILAVPMIGPVLKKIILARFAGVFALTYSSGIPVIECLRAFEGVTHNIVMREGIEHAAARIREGVHLSAAIAETGLFPPLVIRMLRVGESTGALDIALNNVNYFFDRDVNESIARVQSLIEPMLTLALGSVLLWVMVSVMGPVYDLLTRIKI